MPCLICGEQEKRERLDAYCNRFLELKKGTPPLDCEGCVFYNTSAFEKECEFLNNKQFGQEEIDKNYELMMFGTFSMPARCLVSTD